MGENSSIEWCHHTFNPVIGCMKVGPGCDYCYAETYDKRYGGGHWGAGAPRRVTSEANWQKPLQWDRKAAKEGVRKRVFCASLADVFDKEWPDGIRDRLWALIRATPNLDWMLLTKRIGNARDMLPPDWGQGWPNVWLLATVVNQEEANRDVPKLLRIPAVVHGLSIEPMLGRVDLTKIDEDGGFNWMNALGTTHSGMRHRIQLVICGGESGPNARPMHPEWARGLRDQCILFFTAFFFKQWGEFRPADVNHAGVYTPHGGPPVRVGKAAAGRRLDGRTWDQMPERG